MYREETEYASMFYEYVGVATGGELSLNNAANTNKIREEAIAFRKKSLEYMPNGYELQLLEEAVITLMPYCSIYRTSREHELFVSHYALSGVHYFKPI